MLQSMHEKTKGWVAGIVVALLSFAFLLWGVEYYISQARSGGDAVATVNGHKITSAQLEQASRQLQQQVQLSQAGKPLNDDQLQQLRAYVLRTLISKAALWQAAHDAGLRVSTDQVKQIIMSAPEFQEKGQFSEQRFQTLLASSGLTAEQLFDQISTSLVPGQMANGIRATAIVLPKEVQTAFALMKQQRNFVYYTIPVAPFLQNAHPDKKQIEQYYTANKNKFRTDEKIQLSYILLSPKSFEKQIKIEPKALRAYYEEHIANYQTSKGKAKPFTQVKAQVEQALRQQKLSEMLNQKAQDLANAAYTSPTSLKEASAAVGVPLQQTGWLTRDGDQKGLFADPSVLAAAFSDDVLQQGNNSNPVSLKDGSIVVLRVAKHEASEVRPLAEVQDRIVKTLRGEIAQREVGLAAFKIQQAWIKQQDLEKLIKQYNATRVSKEKLPRDSKEVPLPVLDIAFNLQPSVKPSEQSVNTVELPNHDFAVLHVSKAFPGDVAKAKAETVAKMAEQLTRLNGQLEYQFYVKGVTEKAKVSIKEKSDS